MTRLHGYLIGEPLGLLYDCFLEIRDLVSWLRAQFSGGSVSVTSGGQQSSRNVGAIVAAYAPDRAKTVLTAIDALNELGVSILLVVNGRLHPQARERLRGRVWRIIERINTGRDFGAYKAGACHLLREGVIFKRLVVLNDSCFLDGARARGMFERLMDADQDFVGVTENHEPTYHVGSFMFSVSDAVQESVFWRRFWRTYRPSSRRKHAIRAGELGLSRALIRRGRFTPHILYSAADLIPIMRRWSIEDFVENAPLLPLSLRADLHASGLEQLFQDRVTALDVLEFGLPHKSAEHALKRVQSVEQKAARQLALGEIADRLISKFEAGSQIHWAGPLMMRHLGLAILKKDLAYRGLFEFSAAVDCLARAGYSDMDEVVHELRKRGSPLSLRGAARALWQRGYI